MQNYGVDIGITDLIGGTNKRLLFDNSAKFGEVAGLEWDGSLLTQPKSSFASATHAAMVVVSPIGIGQTVVIDWTTGNCKRLDLSAATGTTVVTFTSPVRPTHLTLEIIAHAAPDVPAFTWPTMSWGDVGEPTWETGKKYTVTLWFNGADYRPALAWTDGTPASVGALPAGTGTELQYRASASTFGAITGSSVTGGILQLPQIYFPVVNNAIHSISSGADELCLFVYRVGAGYTQYRQTYSHYEFFGLGGAGGNFNPNDGAMCGGIILKNNITEQLWIASTTASVGILTPVAKPLALGSNQVIGLTLTSTTATLALPTTVAVATALTNAVTNLLTLSHNTSGTPAAGLGTGMLFAIESSTTVDTSAALIDASWVDATHATRKTRLTLSAYDTAVREGIRIEGSGTAPLIGFFGAAAVIQQTKAAHNNWAAIGDVVNALVSLGLLDAA